MSLKIRLRQQGRKNHHTYRLVVMDERAPRNGKYVELLGWYAPAKQTGETIKVDEDRLRFWLSQGAEFSEKAQTLVATAAPSVIKELRERQVKRQEKRKIARRKKKS